MSCIAGTIRTIKGSKVSVTLTFWLDEAKTVARDLSGKTLLMQVRQNQTATPAKEFKTTPGSGEGSLTVGGTDNNEVTVALSSTDNDLAVGSYMWDMMVVTGDGNDEYITPLSLPYTVVDPITEV